MNKLDITSSMKSVKSKTIVSSLFDNYEYKVDFKRNLVFTNLHCLEKKKTGYYSVILKQLLQASFKFVSLKIDFPYIRVSIHNLYKIKIPLTISIRLLNMLRILQNAI